MKRSILTLLLCLGVTAPAVAFELGGEYFLVNNKTIGAVQLGGEISPMLDISADLGFVTSHEDESFQGAAGGFLGSIFGLHLLHKQTIGQGMQLRLGGGFDYWSLYGIHPDEGVGGLVFVSEFRGQIVPNSMFFLRSRFYVVKSDGLQPGIDREGNESAPIILSAGLVWRFQ
ncbi:MAG: hypothetical protein ACPGQS_14705 [Bradymonadia bacterium]